MKSLFLKSISLALLLSSIPMLHADSLESKKALVILAAEYINSEFVHVEKSTKAIGEQYRYMYKHNDMQNTHNLSFWRDKEIHKDKTTEFKLSSKEIYTSYFKYGKTPLSDKNIKELNTLENLSSAIQTAYNSFDYSWIYITTVDNIFSIYPTLALDEAVHNYLPTQQMFYTCADFKNKKVGWSKVYDDLVGAGMMITASYPIYDADKLLGVISRDVTLNELSKKVLSHLTVDENYAAYLVDNEDKVIASSDNAKASDYVMLKKMGVISSKIATMGFWVVLVKVNTTL